jgi:hypothetical protein
MQRCGDQYAYGFNTAPPIAFRGSVFGVRQGFFLAAVPDEGPFMKLKQFAVLFLQKGRRFRPCTQIYDPSL